MPSWGRQDRRRELGFVHLDGAGYLPLLIRTDRALRAYLFVTWPNMRKQRMQGLRRAIGGQQ